ncbi:MAG: hypothetical protein AAB368_02835, partial [bacterium]
DVSLAWQTPCALAGTPRPAAAMSGAQGIVDDALGQALVSWPLAGWTVAAGAAYYDAGELTLNRLDGTSATVRAQQDWLGQAGVATGLFGGAAAAGVSLKYLHSELFEKFSAAAWTADVGAQVRVARGVKLGLAVANVAGTLGYAGGATPLPMALRGGAAAGGSFGEGLLAGALIGAGEWEYLAAEKLLLWKGGLEYQWQGKLALRTGVRSGSGGQPLRVSGGLGVRVGALRVDYALASAKGFDVLPQTLGLTVEF